MDNMADAAVSTENAVVGQLPTEASSGRWGFLRAAVKRVFSKNRTGQAKADKARDTIQMKVEQEKPIIQIPPDSGYANWIRRLEAQKTGKVDLTANELRKLYPHFIETLKTPNSEVSKEEQDKLLESLNDGDQEVVVRLAEFVRDEYLKGKNIAEVRKRNFRNFGNPTIPVYPLELEAILADQLAGRVKLQMEQVPTGIVKVTSGMNLNPDLPTTPGASKLQPPQK